MGKYRFGFNGQERTDEVYGVGNLNTALYWEYDTRLGRRWNVDPVDQISISNYAVNGLNPILLNDPNGDSPSEGDDGNGDDKDKFKPPSNAQVGDIYKDSKGDLFAKLENGIWANELESVEISSKSTNSTSTLSPFNQALRNSSWTGIPKDKVGLGIYNANFGRAYDAGLMPYSPEVIGLTANGNFLYGGGGSFSISLGLSATDGIFMSYAIGGGVGNDVSVAIGGFMADYRGKGKANISSYYNGLSQQNSFGIGPLGISQSSDIFSQDGKHYYGQNWNTLGASLGAGTRLLPMGAVSVTSQVTHGGGISMRDIYNYFKKN